MTISRRTMMIGGASLLSIGTPSLARAAPGRVIMACWGGGTAKVWREDFGASFNKQSGIAFTVAEVPDPATAVAAARGRPAHNVIVAASYQAAGLDLNGHIETFTPDEIPSVRKIPEQYWVRNAEGRLLGMPVYFIYYGIAYNTDLAKEADFASWKSLEDKKWKGKLSVTRPVFAAPYDLTLYSKIMGGDESNIEPGIPMYKAIARNADTAYSSMAQLQQQLAQGEVSAAPFYSGQVQLLRRNGETSVDIALPQEGGLVLSYVLAIPKGSEDREAALAFLNAAIDPVKAAGAARSGYLPLMADVQLPQEVVSTLRMDIDEVRKRNWAPNWFTVAKDLPARIKRIETAL